VWSHPVPRCLSKITATLLRNFIVHPHIRSYRNWQLAPHIPKWRRAQQLVSIKSQLLGQYNICSSKYDSVLKHALRVMASMPRRQARLLPVFQEPCTEALSDPFLPDSYDDFGRHTTTAVTKVFLNQSINQSMIYLNSRQTPTVE